MRHSKAFALVALCLCLFGTARAQVQATAAAGSVLTGVPTQGGMAAMLKGSIDAMTAAVKPMAKQMSAQAEAMAAQLEALYVAAEAQYCTPASFTPSEKVPAKFVGHSMSITFDMGSCTFNESRWIHDGVKELNCTEPSISYVKTPANFTSKYHSAPEFTSKECKLPAKTFGESVEKVLFVFDGSQAPNMESLTATITQEVKNVLGTVQSGTADLISSAKAAASGLLGKGALATASASAGAVPTFTYT